MTKANKFVPNINCFSPHYIKKTNKSNCSKHWRSSSDQCHNSQLHAHFQIGRLKMEPAHVFPLLTSQWALLNTITMATREVSWIVFLNHCSDCDCNIQSQGKNVWVQSLQKMLRSVPVKTQCERWQVHTFWISPTGQKEVQNFPFSDCELLPV